MITYTGSASARIAASSERAYATIADYRQGHPSILPKAFTGLRVEEGGVGAGTVIRVQMRLLGRSFEFRGVVTEPVPGHMLVERNVGDGVPESVTTFTIEPGGSADECVVTISSEFAGRSGIVGAVERILSQSVLRRLYVEELQRLDAVASGR